MTETKREQPHNEQRWVLYDYWSEQFSEWAKGPHRLQLHDKNTTEAHKLIAAIFGLLRNMRRDGYLAYRRSGDDIGVEQLAEIMHVSKTTALIYLEWLRRRRELAVTPMFSEEKGHPLPSMRRLVIPKPQVQWSSSEVDLGLAETPSPVNGGPKSSEPGSQVQWSSSAVTPTQGDPGKETQGEYLSGDTALSGDLRHVSNHDLEEGEGESTREARSGEPRRETFHDASSQQETLETRRDPSLGAERARARDQEARVTTDDYPEGPDGEPCYAWLSQECWDRVRSQLPHTSLFNLRHGMVEMSAIGSRLTFWFQYTAHLQKAMGDAPLLRELVRQELGADIVVELMAMSEIYQTEPVAGCPSPAAQLAEIAGWMPAAE